MTFLVAVPPLRMITGKRSVCERSFLVGTIAMGFHTNENMVLQTPGHL